jgi:outer membrane protein
MAERFNAAVLKTVVLMGPGVRIPLSPLKAPTMGLFYSRISFARGMFVLRSVLMGLMMLILAIPSTYSKAQSRDTLRISLEEFLLKGKANSAELKSRKKSVQLSENTLEEAKLSTLFPRFELTTNHGIIPDVTSDSILASGKPLPREEYYLDPDVEYDWSRFKLFTQLELRILQPIYTWGAIKNAINAAQLAASATKENYEAEEEKVHLRFYEFYQAKLLSGQLKRIIDEAYEELLQAEKKLDELIEKGDSAIDDSDVYKVKIFKQEFMARKEEVYENDAFLHATWLTILGFDSTLTVLPENEELTVNEESTSSIAYYYSNATTYRNEIRALDYAVNAAESAWKAANAQRYPSIFLGLGAEYVYSPRPVQFQPLFGNRYNYLNVMYSFGIRQNLNFASTNQKSDRAKLIWQQSQYTREAVVTGLSVDVNDKLKKVKINQKNLSTTSDALQISKEWLQQEQIDYDLGLGDIKDLVDAVKSTLELEVRYQQSIYELNISIARLRNASGLSITN